MHVTFYRWSDWLFRSWIINALLKSYIRKSSLTKLALFFSTEVQDICCVGSEIYVYDSEGYVKWFGLLSVKECVARLHKIGEVKQCVMVRDFSKANTSFS